MIRDDGSAYSLSNGGKNYIIGEMDLFVAGGDNVLAEASSSLLTIAIDTVPYKDKLLQNIAFLQLMATTLANKISTIAYQHIYKRLALHQSLHCYIFFSSKTLRTGHLSRCFLPL